MNQAKSKIQQVQAPIEKGFIEELTDKVRTLLQAWGQIPQNVQQILTNEYEACAQQLSENEGVAEIDQYFDEKTNTCWPHLWKLRLRATGNYEGKEFVGWLVFPADFPNQWPVFCFCYPKHNNMGKTDQNKLAFQHENIYQSGELCIPALERVAWVVQGQRNLKDICQKIGDIIGHPNNASPANQKLVENSEQSKKLLIQTQLQFLNDYQS